MPTSTGTGVLVADPATIDESEGGIVAQEFGLNPINYTSINGVRVPPVLLGALPEGGNLIAIRYPIGGSPIYRLQYFEEYETTLLCRVYADGRLVMEFEPIDQVMFRLPSGFKAHRYQFELIGNANVYSLAAAETARELKDV